MMAKLYGLQASGALRLTLTDRGDILCGKLFTERGFAEEHMPAFRTACTSSPSDSPASLRDLADDERLKIHMIEFELVR